MFERIKKFGWNRHHELGTMLDNVACMLRLLALNIDGRYKKRIPFFFYIFVLTSLVCYIHVFQVSMYWFIFWRRGGEIPLEKIIVFSMGANSLMGVVKFGYMYLKRDGLKEVIAAYLVCDAKVIKHSRMSRSIDVTLRGVKRRATIFWMVIVGNAVVYIIIPLVTPGRHLSDDNQIIWGLEPMVESPNFEIAYVVTTLCVPIVVLAPVNLTSFLIIIIGYTEAHMIALSQELLNLWEDAQIDCKKKALENNHVPSAFDRDLLNLYVKRRLETIMRAHAADKKLVKQVEDIYKNAVAIEFALLSTGLVTALLGGLENTYLKVPFALVLVAMDCIIGQRLLDANSCFEAAAYRCKWENFDVSNMKLVLMMLQNAQNTMKLSAGGVTCLSYASLMLLIKSIYSAYTALRSTMNEV